MLRSILHCDMNNFYASVECMLDPALKKYPIAVCGSVEERHGKRKAKNHEKVAGFGREFIDSKTSEKPVKSRTFGDL